MYHLETIAAIDLKNGLKTWIFVISELCNPYLIQLTKLSSHAHCPINLLVRPHIGESITHTSYTLIQ